MTKCIDNYLMYYQIATRSILIALVISGCDVSRSNDGALDAVESQAIIDKMIQKMVDSYNSTAESGDFHKSREDFRLIVKEIDKTFGNAGPSLLIEALNRSDNEIEKYSIIGAIASFGESAVSETPQLVAMLGREQSDYIQVQMLRAIQDINGEGYTWAEGIIPYLTLSLSSNEPLLRDEVALILGELGPLAVPAVPELISTMIDPSKGPNCRRFAAYALGAIAPESQRVFEAMKKGLDDPLIAESVREVLDRIDEKAE